MNNLFQQLNPPRQLLSKMPANVKQMVQMFKGISNPEAMAQKLVNENPQLKSAIQMANGNPEQAFRTMAKQMNVDPNEIIDMLK